MSKLKLMIFLSISFIASIYIITMVREPLIGQDANELRIRYEESVSGNNSIFLDMSDEGENAELFSFIKEEKGWLVSAGLSDFLLGNQPFTQEDSVITIYSDGESVAVYSSGAIWDIAEQKFICLDFISGREKGEELYNHIFDLISHDF